jgi:hypothetical protein
MYFGSQSFPRHGFRDLYAAALAENARDQAQRL